MTTLAPEFNLTDTAAWGVKANGASLSVGTTATVKPLYGKTLTLDVENNPDGSCAGVGVTADGEDIVFFPAAVFLEFPRYAFCGYQLVGHNIKYDVQMLRKWGFDVTPDQIVWDTQIAEYVKDSTKNRYGLKLLVEQIFNKTYPNYKALTGAGKKAIPIGQVAPDILANYNGCDVLFTYRLYQKQLAELTEEQTQYLERVELPTMRVLLEMEERGVQIDAAHIRNLDAGFGDGISVVADRIRSVATDPINLNSHQQIKRLLLDKAGLSLQSTAAEELKKHTSIPLIKDILRYRELNKLKSTYTEGLLEKANGQETYRLHARFNQTSTHTGRLSSSDPNLQNIPTRTDEGDAIRKGFVAKPGAVLVDVDYSQIEPRLMAHFSKDPVFMKVFHDGKSIYEAVIDMLGLLAVCKGDKDEAKRIAKVMWLALAYNAGAFKLSQAAGITRSEAEVFITKMKLSLSTFFYWRSKTIAKAEIEGGVRTLLGRFIPLPPDLAHLGPNYIVQGSAAEINKLGLMAVRDYFPVINVHDETLFELPASSVERVLPDIKERMSTVVELSVPLAVSIGQGGSWSEAKA